MAEEGKFFRASTKSRISRQGYQVGRKEMTVAAIKKIHQEYVE